MSRELEDLPIPDPSRGALDPHRGVVLPKDFELVPQQLDVVDDSTSTIAICAAILLAAGGSAARARNTKHQLEAVTTARELLELARKPQDEDERKNNR